MQILKKDKEKQTPVPATPQPEEKVMTEQEKRERALKNWAILRKHIK